MKYWDLTIPNLEATPKNVRLADRRPLRETRFIPFRRVYILGDSVMSSGVYPAEGHVRTPDQYGPSGAEFQGTETLPAEADVKVGIPYGADGTEFTGTYSPGGGGIKSQGIGSSHVRGGQ